MVNVKLVSLFFQKKMARYLLSDIICVKVTHGHSVRGIRKNRFHPHRSERMHSSVQERTGYFSRGCFGGQVRKL